MTTTSACLSGCTQRGSHLTTCETKGAEIDPCTGCLPRAAEFGNLCPFCWQRLNSDVIDAPALAHYLWALAHSGVTSTAEIKIDGGDPSERGIIHAAIDTLDGLHACLASWAHLILEEHPDGAHMTGPDEACVRLSGSTKRIDPNVFPRLEGEPTVYIVRREVVGIHDPDATSRLVRWMLPQLPWCAAQEWAGEMRREIADVVRTTAARFPVAERTRPIPGVTCPVCDRTSLAFDPPTPERPTTQVNCTRRGCGVIFTEDEFKRLTRIIEWEHQQDQSA